MNEQQIALKSVNELRVNNSGASLHYFIPGYQRGFRWSPMQIRQLLDDIREFSQRRNPKPEEFYCLQPLVIKARPDEGDFEVVDGQQRLTTLLLIMRHFNERLAERYRQTLFRLDYKTRPNLDAFLEEPDEAVANDNVDFYHLFHAIRTIEDWFEERDSEVEKVKDALLNQTKIIWFQLADSDNPVEAFTRLNVGKIPLTNDELIRALFLRRSGPDEKDATSLQLRIAYEWDQLEKALQSDAFWFFLSNLPGKSDNRIGFLFELVVLASGQAPGAKDDAYGIFYTFNQNLKTPDKTPENEWWKIKQLYLQLEEWFEDRVLYHMVGFLVSQGMSIIDIQSLSVDCTKSDFVQHLREEIFERATGEKMPDPPKRDAVRDCVANRLEELTYLSHRDKIRALLLLFNLATLLQNRRSNLRFQFDSFKSERWDIEHIRSVTDDRPERHHERRDWLKNSLGYLVSKDEDEKLQEDIREFLTLSQADAANEVFDPLYERVLDFFHEGKGSEAEHGISNLTLLDESTNRSYKNAVFAVKRQRLLDLDQAGIFVPLCTRNVFLKCYSPRVDNVMFWGDNDRDCYISAIADVLADFFCGIMEGYQ
ncbi:MAG: DUF262 domain-containing protein [Chlorobiaceae bacterium]|nr:DUF262 domain-containing protein [Chlorobiaceae bacterium]